VALTIAGSDSGGGAGIQADLKAFARCGVHGTSAITAITAQNTLAVTAIHPVPPEIVLAQVRAVLADVGVDAVKVGMLGTVEVTLAVARALDELPRGTPVVVDPVMVAESGVRLLDEDAQQALIAEVVPRASVLTPNLPEARVLAGLPAGEGDTAGGQGEDEALALARAVLALGPDAVVLTGGHRARATDLLLERAQRDGGNREAVPPETAGERHHDKGRHEGDAGGRQDKGGHEGAPVSRHDKGGHEIAAVEIPGERHRDGAAHGSGCTHSAVLAARLALGDTTRQAARIARSLAGESVARGLRDVGAGAGPVDVLGLERMRETR
jgi:hydroxymethylpyrimidine/phosphomethylpyrimidine kinase